MNLGFGDSLYHPLVVIWGLFLHGFTTVLRSEFSSRVEIYFPPEEAEPAEIIF